MEMGSSCHELAPQGMAAPREANCGRGCASSPFWNSRAFPVLGRPDDDGMLLSQSCSPGSVLPSGGQSWKSGDSFPSLAPQEVFGPALLWYNVFGHYRDLSLALF